MFPPVLGGKGGPGKGKRVLKKEQGAAEGEKLPGAGLFGSYP